VKPSLFCFGGVRSKNAAGFGGLKGGVRSIERTRSATRRPSTHERYARGGAISNGQATISGDAKDFRAIYTCDWGERGRRCPFWAMSGKSPGEEKTQNSTKCHAETVVTRAIANRSCQSMGSDALKTLRVVGPSRVA